MCFLKTENTFYPRSFFKTEAVTSPTEPTAISLTKGIHTRAKCDTQTVTDM